MQKMNFFGIRKTSCLCSSSFNQLLLSFLIYFHFFFVNVFFIFKQQKCLFFFGLKLFRGVKTGAEKKKKKMTAEKTEIYKHTPHRVCATVFHRRHFVNAPLSDLNSLYIETVCANAGSQTRCCTTLYVARCFIVLSCAVCNKDKVSATLWRLKWIIEVWRCDVCLLTIWNH